MSSDEYKTGSVQKAKKQIKEVQQTKQQRLNEIMKQMKSSTVGGKE